MDFHLGDSPDFLRGFDTLETAGFTEGCVIFVKTPKCDERAGDAKAEKAAQEAEDAAALKQQQEDEAAMAAATHESLSADGTVEHVKAYLLEQMEEPLFQLEKQEGWIEFI